MWSGRQGPCRYRSYVPQSSCLKNIIFKNLILKSHITDLFKKLVSHWRLIYDKAVLFVRSI